jgi:hypothetical protein
LQGASNLKNLFITTLLCFSSAILLYSSKSNNYFLNSLIGTLNLNNSNKSSLINIKSKDKTINTLNLLNYFKNIF